jgi:hypothetical protein
LQEYYRQEKFWIRRNETFLLFHPQNRYEWLFFFTSSWTFSLSCSSIICDKGKTLAMMKISLIIVPKIGIKILFLITKLLCLCLKIVLTFLDSMVSFKSTLLSID